MTLPTLQQLRYLVALAEHLHFGRAASACGVTQSALSAGIQELERLLGVTLVERTQRRVMLTAVGAGIVGRAAELLVGAQDLVESARVSAAPLSTPLRLGVIPTIGPYLLPLVLARLRSSYPDLGVYLREEQTARLTEGLRSGALDAAVVALPYDLGDLVVRDVGADPLLVACAPSHPLAQERVIDEEDLDAARLLLLEDGHCLRDQALEACRLRAETNEVFQATSLRTLVEMVAGELGVTFMPGMAVEAETAGRADVVVRPLSGRKERRIALVWRRRAAREHEYQLLADEIERSLGGAANG